MQSVLIQTYIYMLFALIQAIITLKMKLILKFFKREVSLFLSAKFQFEFESAESGLCIQREIPPPEKLSEFSSLRSEKI